MAMGESSGPAGGYAAGMVMSDDGGGNPPGVCDQLGNDKQTENDLGLPNLNGDPKAQLPKNLSQSYGRRPAARKPKRK